MTTGFIFFFGKMFCNVKTLLYILQKLSETHENYQGTWGPVLYSYICLTHLLHDSAHRRIMRAELVSNLLSGIPGTRMGFMDGFVSLSLAGSDESRGKVRQRRSLYKALESRNLPEVMRKKCFDPLPRQSHGGITD